MTGLLQPASVDLRDYTRLLDSKVTTEGMDIITSIPKFFTDRMASVTGFFKSGEQKLEKYDVKKLNVYYKMLYTNSRKMRLAKDIDYSLIKRRKVPATIGIKVDILEMAKGLRAANNIVRTTTITMLKETSVIVAKLASDPDYRLSSRPILINERYQEALDTLNDIIDSILDPKNISDNTTVGKLAPSVMHITEATKIAMTYSDTGNIQFFTDMKNEIDVIASYTETLEEVLKGKNISVKKTRIDEVATYLGTAADLVTKSTNILYLSTQSVIMLNSLVKTISK